MTVDSCRMLAAITGAALAMASSLSAGSALFPKPLHLSRRIEDPLAQRAAAQPKAAAPRAIEIEEYFAGSRVVTIAGDRVAIADYERQELTEIDRAAATYSITRFDAIANARNAQSPSRARKQPEWSISPRGPRASTPGRTLETFLLSQSGPQTRTIEVSIDRDVRLSREAVEVIAGAAYPNVRSVEHDAILRAASEGNGRPRIATTSTTSSATSTSTPASALTPEETWALPSETVVRYEEEGAGVTFRNRVTRVGAELPPAEALVIPAGARRVDSRLVVIRRELEALDRGTVPAQGHE